MCYVNPQICYRIVPNHLESCEGPHQSERIIDCNESGPVYESFRIIANHVPNHIEIVQRIVTTNHIRINTESLASRSDSGARYGLRRTVAESPPNQAESCPNHSARHSCDSRTIQNDSNMIRNMIPKPARSTHDCRPNHFESSRIT